MNVADLIKEFRTLAQDTAKPYLWPDEEVKPWLTDAEKEAAIRARLIRDTTEIDVSIGDTECILPRTLFDIQYAELRAADGTAYELGAATHADLDKFRRGWRTRSERPREYIHNDKTLTLGAVSDAAYVLYLDFYRIPSSGLNTETAIPEINAAHHIHLLEWVLHKAYGKPDADGMNPTKSAESEAKFTAYFGKRPTADLRRRQNANRPHRNAAHL